MSKKLFFVCAALLMSHSVLAVNFLEKKVVKVGKPVPDFRLTDTRGAEHQLSSYRGKLVMLHFWSATCPFVIRYDDRLKEIASDYQGRDVVVLGVDSNSNETVKQIKKVAGKRKINYPILIDPGNQVADQFGAITTPHVFLIDQEGKLIYEGAVDDQGWSEDNPVRKHYVREVIEANLSGKPVPYTETQSVGCTVKRAF